MSKTKKIKRIFYFNINFTCDNDCVFCYSHNTWHSGVVHNELSCKDLISFLRTKNVNENDRIIINGGEPLLHSEINNILHDLEDIRCEILVYTNGRNIHKLNMEYLNENCRYIIPIHGYEQLHDIITRRQGSYRETVDGLERLYGLGCKVDVKLIINNYMVNDEQKVYDTVVSLENIKYSNAIHLTTMADTIVSKRNKCESISKDDAARSTLMFYESLKAFNRHIKIFDTCIKHFSFLENTDVKKYTTELEVFYKAYNQYRKWELLDEHDSECSSCRLKQFCKSAVKTYLTLECDNDIFFENLE